MKITAVAALAVALCACAIPYHQLPPEQGSSSYHKLNLNFGTSSKNGPATESAAIVFYLRRFDSNGKLGLCGYYVTSSSFSGTPRALFPSWLQGAVLYLGDEKLAPANFMPSREPRYSEYDAEAACIRTETPFALEDLGKSIQIRGQNVRMLM